MRRVEGITMSWRNRPEVGEATEKLLSAASKLRVLSWQSCMLGDGQRCMCPSCRARRWIRAIEGADQERTST